MCPAGDGHRCVQLLDWKYPLETEAISKWILVVDDEGVLTRYERLPFDLGDDRDYFFRSLKFGVGS